MHYSLSEADCRALDVSTRREWLLTNGIGGYASSTVSGINTRRYHGLLVAATQPPTGRQVLLAALDAFIGNGSERLGISCNQYPGAIFPEGFLYLRSFSVSDEAVWSFETRGLRVERRVRMLRGTNGVLVEYRNVGERAFDLSVRPLICHKPYHTNFRERVGYPQRLKLDPNLTTVEHGGISLVLRHEGARSEPVQGWYYRFEHAREADRGLDSRDDLYCPCEWNYTIPPGGEATIVASEGPLPTQENMAESCSDHQFDLIGRLKHAARHFLVETPRRATIMAGYPWFSDWGRDTMISLPGICLHTGHVETARRILRDYGAQTFKGLIPNRFVEEGETPDYNTVDATLWYANAIYKTLIAEWDQEFATEMYAVLKQIYVWHKTGTLYGIRMDPSDGLLTQGERGVQLTWMDAKVGDWVVTPRHGKPVEINGLWINMLRILEWLSVELGDDGTEYSESAERAEQWFELKFFHEQRGHYVDTVDPLDVTLRPNQVIAMALPFGPAKGHRAKRALEVITRDLYTNRGLRTLGPRETSYRGRYEGALPQLDAAYHQGTAWPWLLGPYASALVRVNDDREAARKVLAVAEEMLSECGLGGIAEVYDGNEPQRPNGCPWQAWSTAEILRALIEDVPA
jgi:predicted glycogen debranching enzyme